MGTEYAQQALEGWLSNRTPVFLKVMQYPWYLRITRP